MFAVTEEQAPAEPDEVLAYRERHVAAWPWHVSGLLLTVLATTPAWVAIYWVVPFPLFLALIFWIASTGLRITVSHRDVEVQHGLLSAKIALGRIESIKVVEHGWGRHNFGVGRTADGARRFHVARASNEAVRIRWRDEGDQERSVVFSADRADRVVEAIELARSRAKPPDLP